MVSRPVTIPIMAKDFGIDNYFSIDFMKTWFHIRMDLWHPEKISLREHTGKLRFYGAYLEEKDAPSRRY